MKLIKPNKLNKGDKVATVSPCHGWAGDPDINWKYKLGVEHLYELELEVVAVPNSLKGSEYLSIIRPSFRCNVSLSILPESYSFLTLAKNVSGSTICETTSARTGASSFLMIKSRGIPNISRK